MLVLFALLVASVNCYYSYKPSYSPYSYSPSYYSYSPSYYSYSYYSYRECYYNSDCYGNRPYCRSGSCVECIADSDCHGTGGCGPYCSIGYCRYGQTCSGLTPYCLNGKTCVQCLATSDCRTDKYCDSNCNSNACSRPAKDCTVNVVEKKCNSTTALCVQCISDSDCGGSTPYCFANTCVQCIESKHCRKDEDCTASCQSDHTCASGAPVVNCALTNASLPHCEINTATCVECVLDSQCPSFQPFCKGASEYQCVNCSSHLHCRSNENCNALCQYNNIDDNKCVLGKVNVSTPTGLVLNETIVNCTQSLSTPFCYENDALCVECFQDSHCALQPENKKVCNLYTFKCDAVKVVSSLFVLLFVILVLL